MNISFYNVLIGIAAIAVIFTVIYFLIKSLINYYIEQRNKNGR